MGDGPLDIANVYRWMVLTQGCALISWTNEVLKSLFEMIHKPPFPGGLGFKVGLIILL